MADKTTPLILDALSRAVAVPGGQALHGTKTAPGLFAGTAVAKQAAQYCKEAGYLQVVRTETKGKGVQEIVTITEQGIAYLLGQCSPKEVLQEFVRAVEARGQQVCDLIEAARQCQGTFESLKTQVQKVLTQVSVTAPSPSLATVSGNNGASPWKTEVLAYLIHWQATRPNEDCPLPELYRRAKQSASGLTVGQFQDGLRQLHDQGQVYLHPWTGPLYEIPDPACALLVGHAVAYYASRKS